MASTTDLTTHESGACDRVPSGFRRALVRQQSLFVRRISWFVGATLVLFVLLLAASAPGAAQQPGQPEADSSDASEPGAGGPLDGESVDTAPVREPLGAQQADDPSDSTDDQFIDVTEPTAPGEPDVGISIEGQGGLTQTVSIILLLTVGAVAPSIILLTTSFTRFAIVLSLTRNAIGTQQVPPTQVLTGLALFLTLFVMGPILSQINEESIQPMLAGEIDQGEAFETGFDPLRDFMLAQTSDDDLRLFLDMRGEQLAEGEEVDATVLIPAFVMSELRTAFTIGFVIFVPFLVIDLVVSSVLMSLGMVMLPPVFISLPLKLLLFVLVDGWGLIVKSLVSSVNTVT